MRQARLKSKKRTRSLHATPRVEQRSKKTDEAIKRLIKNSFEEYSKEALNLDLDSTFQDEIDEKYPLNPTAELPDPAFEQCGARCELPARETFGDDEFQKRTDEHGPQDCRAQDAAGKRCGGEIATADTGRS